MHLRTRLGVAAPRSQLALLTVGSNSGLQRRWPACRSPRAKCRTTRNSQRNSPSRTPGPGTKMPAPRRRLRLARLQCLKAVTAPTPSPWLGLAGTTTAHYSFWLDLAVAAVVVPGLQSLFHPWRSAPPATIPRLSHPSPRRRDATSPTPARAESPTEPRVAGNVLWSGS
jgi:hypothetical protein